MPAQKIILHVGPHKTGSTALQQALTVGRDQLAARGILYPKSGFSSYGHHQIVDAARGWVSDFDIEAFRSEVASASKVILSSENAVHLSAEHLAVFRGMIPEKSEIQVIYYLRRLPDLWASHWQELIKHGETMTFYEYLARATGAIPSGHRVVASQIEQLNKLAHVFGRDALTIFGYDYLQDAGVDFTSHFLAETLGEDVGGLSTARINISSPSWHIELVRQLNIIHKLNAGKIASYRLRSRVFQHLRDGSVPFASEFKQAYDDRSAVCELSNTGRSIAALQQDAIQFKDRMSEAVKTMNCFTMPSIKKVPVFEMPAYGLGGLKGAISDYYQRNVTPEWHV